MVSYGFSVGVLWFLMVFQGRDLLNLSSHRYGDDVVATDAQPWLRGATRSYGRECPLKGLWARAGPGTRGANLRDPLLCGSGNCTAHSRIGFTLLFPYHHPVLRYHTSGGTRGATDEHALMSCHMLLFTTPKRCYATLKFSMDTKQRVYGFTVDSIWHACLIISAALWQTFHPQWSSQVVMALRSSSCSMSRDFACSRPSGYNLSV